MRLKDGDAEDGDADAFASIKLAEILEKSSNLLPWVRVNRAAVINRCVKEAAVPTPPRSCATL